jgi:hypothetical protein
VSAREHASRPGAFEVALATVTVTCAAIFLLAVATAGTPAAPGGERVTGSMIPPGREASVLALFDAWPDRRFAGRTIAAVRIDHDTVLADLADGAAASGACSMPWARAPGTVRIGPSDEPLVAASDGTLGIDWDLCGRADGSRAAEDAARLAAALTADRVATIWSPGAVGETGVPVGGLLAPAAALVGLPAPRAVVIFFAVGIAAALAASWVVSRRRPLAELPAQAHPRAWIAVVVVGASALAARLALAASVPPDGDEPWAMPPFTYLFTDDHDAWVHPPLFRAVAELHVRAIGWSEGDPLWALRLPSILAGTLAVTLAAWLVARRSTAVWTPLTLLVPALAPELVTDCIRARPYALASLFVVIVVSACLSRGPPVLRTFVALVGTGLAAYTDLVAGLACVLVVGAQAVFAWRWRPAGERFLGPSVASVLAVSVLLGPIAPGAIHALGHERARLGPSGAGPDLRPHDDPAAPERGLFGRAGELATFGAFGASERSPVGLALVLALLAAPLTSRRARAVPEAWLPLACLALVVALATELALRTRNVLFLPHVTWLCAALLVPIWSRPAAAAPAPP